MIQFKFDNKYVSGIDALLKECRDVRPAAPGKTAASAGTPRLLPEAGLPFRLEKRPHAEGGDGPDGRS